ncbi:MAG: hypothetical protein JXA42_01760 [Anaerolineales bacterium]|nr:hypothetical protein [Anaerolineales bacterium]
MSKDLLAACYCLGGIGLLAILWFLASLVFKIYPKYQREKGYEKKFGYPKWTEMAISKEASLMLFPISVAFICIPFLTSDGTILQRILAFLFGCAFFIESISLANLYPDIWLYGDNLGIQFLFFWKKRIEIEEILSISEGLYGRYGEITNPVWIVEVPKLGWPYRFHGCFLSRKNIPGFIVHVYMDGSEELMSLIKEYIGANNSVFKS